MPLLIITAFVIQVTRVWCKVTIPLTSWSRRGRKHQDYVAWLASCVHSDPFFGKTCERRAKERSETYVALQKPTETIAVLTWYT